VIPLRPTPADVVDRSTRYLHPERDDFWTWCQGCGRWMPVVDYLRHLEMVTLAAEAKP